MSPWVGFARRPLSRSARQTSYASYASVSGMTMALRSPFPLTKEHTSGFNFSFNSDRKTVPKR